MWLSNQSSTCTGERSLPCCCMPQWASMKRANNGKAALLIGDLAILRNTHRPKKSRFVQAQSIVVGISVVETRSRPECIMVKPLIDLVPSLLRSANEASTSCPFQLVPSWEVWRTIGVKNQSFQFNIINAIWLSSLCSRMYVLYFTFNGWTLDFQLCYIQLATFLNGCIFLHLTFNFTVFKLQNVLTSPIS